MTDLFEPQGDQPAVTFDSLVGEGKKFKTPDELAKAKAESDRFIEQLQSEAAIARQELRSRTNLEEVVAQLKAGRETPPNREPAPTPRPDAVVEDKTPNIEEQIAKALDARKNKESYEANIETARTGLKERFGADYNQTLESIVSELGVSKKFALDLAGSSPTGFLRLIDSVKAPDDKRPTTPPVNRINTVLPNNSGRRNKAHYDDLRRTDINKFLSPAVQKAYYKDAMEQGDDFYK